MTFLSFGATASSTPPLRVGTAPWWPVWAVVALQVVLQAYFFPFSELLSARRITYIDAPFHQYQMELALALCRSGRLTGYDPFFAAGYVGGVTFNASAKLQALIACAFDSSAAIAPIYKVASFGLGVLAPASLALASGLLRWPATASWIAAVTGVLLWWTGPMRWYHTAGLVSWVAIAFVSVPYSIATAKVCLRPRAGQVLAVAVAGAVGMLMHPLFPLAVLMLALPLLWAMWEPGRVELIRSAWAALFVCLVVVCFNGPWVLAAFSAPSYASVAPQHQRAVQPLLVLLEMLGQAPTAASGSRLYLALAIGALAALVLARGAVGRQIRALAVGALLMIVWASFGGLSDRIAVLQPNRSVPSLGSC